MQRHENVFQREEDDYCKTVRQFTTWPNEVRKAAFGNTGSNVVRVKRNCVDIVDNTKNKTVQ